MKFSFYKERVRCCFILHADGPEVGIYKKKSKRKLKENTLSTKKKSKPKEKVKENALTTKKKVRKQDLDHTIDQKNKF